VVRGPSFSANTNPNPYRSAYLRYLRQCGQCSGGANAGPQVARFCQARPPKFSTWPILPLHVRLGLDGKSHPSQIYSTAIHKMATVAPPPSKRQRREELERSQVQQDVTAVAAADLGSFKARFVDSDGNQMTDVVEIPLADATEKNVSLLLNTLLGRVCITPATVHLYRGLTYLSSRTAKTTPPIASESTSPPPPKTPRHQQQQS
jgi:hypothetical protein